MSKGGGQHPTTTQQINPQRSGPTSGQVPSSQFKMHITFCNLSIDTRKQQQQYRMLTTDFGSFFFLNQIISNTLLNVKSPRKPLKNEPYQHLELLWSMQHLPCSNLSPAACMCVPLKPRGTDGHWLLQITPNFLLFMKNYENFMSNIKV